jgi:8-oxo-dGTP diphosphatase
MPVTDQDITRDRYMLVPRVAVFIRRDDSYLLIKGAPTKRRWAGKYNGIGGHVERGEDILTAARRELLEETALEADLWLCGTVVVDAGEIGVGLYIFTAEHSEGELEASAEGSPEWVRYEDVASLPAVEDLPVLLDHIQAMKPGMPPFSARSFYDRDGRLQVVFAD